MPTTKSGPAAIARGGVACIVSGSCSATFMLVLVLLHLLENLHQVAVGLLRAVFRFAQLASAGTHARCFFRVIDELLNSSRQFFRLTRFKKQPGLPFFHDVRQASH